MFNSGNIQIPSSSSLDTPSTQIYNHDEVSNNTLKDQENPAFLLSSEFPSIIDEDQFPLCRIFSQMQSAIHGDVVDRENKNNNNSISHPENPCEVIKPTTRRNLGPSSRRKTGKKSRHTKICTAQGVRDRRMRLSLPVARKFFDLQDLLGFDKASKTIEWLFSNSQQAIKELQMENIPQGKDSYCSSDEEESEAKFMSNFEVKSANNDGEEYPNNENDMTKSRKPLFNYSHAKQCRERARARARERTREKMKSKGTKQWYESNPSKDDREHLGHFYPFNDQSSSRTQYVQSEENDTNCTSFIGLIEHLEGSKNNSTMGLATGDLDVSTYCLPARKFPFLFQ